MLYRRVVVERLHLENGLLPYLNPDSVLVMDNMKSHHGKAIKQLLEGAKARYILVVSRVMRKIVYGSGRNLLQGAA